MLRRRCLLWLAGNTPRQASPAVPRQERPAYGSAKGGTAARQQRGGCWAGVRADERDIYGGSVICDRVRLGSQTSRTPRQRAPGLKLGFSRVSRSSSPRSRPLIGPQRRHRLGDLDAQPAGHRRAGMSLRPARERCGRPRECCDGRAQRRIFPGYRRPLAHAHSSPEETTLRRWPSLGPEFARAARVMIENCQSAANCYTQGNDIRTAIHTPRFV